MANTYQHISFAQLVYFSYICGRQGLASYKHLSSNAASHFSSGEAEICLSLFCRHLPLQLLLSWEYFTSSALTCCLSNLTLFPPEVSFSKLFQASKSSKTSFDTFLDPQSQFGRDHMAGGFSEAGGNHFTGSRIQWQQLSRGLSLDRPSLLPGCSLGGEARWSCPRGEAHQAGLPHEPGVQRCVRRCCC